MATVTKKAMTRGGLIKMLMNGLPRNGTRIHSANVQLHSPEHLRDDCTGETFDDGNVKSHNATIEIEAEWPRRKQKKKKRTPVEQPSEEEACECCEHCGQPIVKEE